MDNNQIRIETTRIGMTTSKRIRVGFAGGEETIADPITVDDDNFALTDMNPKTAPPGLKTDLVITGTSFGTDPSQIYVDLINNLHETDRTLYPNYRLTPWKLTDTEMTVVLPGGRIGHYTLKMHKRNFGNNLVPTPGNDQFSYAMTVTSVSHSTGSLFGGLELLITGTHFSPVLNQNKVTVSVFRNWNKTCYIQSANETHISC